MVPPLRSVACLLALVAVSVSGHANHRSACDEVKSPMQNFNPDRFLGEWFVVRSFDPDVSCLRFNYTSCGEGCLKVQERKQINFIDKIGVSNVYETDGTLTVRGDDPADMEASFRTNPRSALYTILATDYTSFAAVFTCQNIGADALPLYHRRDVYILARNQSVPLTPEQVELVSSAMEVNMIEDEFEDVTHEKCTTADDATLDLNVSQLGQRVKTVASTVASGFSKFASSIAGLFSSSKDEEPASAGVSPLRRRRGAHFH